MIEIPTTAQAIEHGRRLAYSVTICAECHGDDVGGKVLIDEAPLGFVPGAFLFTRICEIGSR